MPTGTQKTPKLEDRASRGLIDLTKTGPLTYRELQALNSNLPEESNISKSLPNRLGSAAFDPERASSINYTGKEDTYGESAYDSPLASMYEYSNYQDLRGQRQPWYMQLLNGTAKGAITAGATLVDGTIGLVAGLGQGAVNLGDEDETTGFVQGIWDNEVIKGSQKVIDWAEQAFPNYYTEEERNSPWYTNIFTSNFIGDKFIKNLGFTVGAFYGGSLFSKALESVAWMPGMLKAGTASIIAAVGEGSIEAVNNSRDWYNYYKQLLDNSRDNDLKEYQESFRPRIQEIMDEYDQNKGKGLVINRESGVAYDPAILERDRKLNELRAEYDEGKSKIDSNHDLGMQKLNEDRAKMGNMDLLLNIPILTASNIFQFGKLWANGFKTANRTSKIVRGTNGTYEAVKSKVEPWAKGIGRSLSEGFEEINQKAASEVSGIHYGDEVMDYYKKAKDPDAEQETLNWINSFSEGIAKTYGDESSWEEFFIGTLTGALGMPAFGKSNTQQAYLGRGKSFGMVGGMADAFSEYNDRVKRDEEIANALNERVQSPEFKDYYQGMIRHYKLQSEMDKASNAGDEFEFKNAEHSQLVNDIAMWDNAGKIDDLIQMIEEAADTSPENIADIIRSTTKTLKAHPQYQQAIDVLSSEIEGLTSKAESLRKTANIALNENEDMDAYNAIMDQVAELESQIASKSEELYSQRQKRDLFVGPFVDEKGNPYDEAYIKGKIEQNKKDILDAVELYRNTKREIDSATNFSLNSEQLATLTWLKSHKKNWDDRAASMSGDIKQFAIPAILSGVQEELDDINKQLSSFPEILSGENRKKSKELQEDVELLMNIRDTLTKMRELDDEHFGRALAISPQLGNLIKIALAKPQIAQQVSGEEVWNLMKEVDDIIKASEASMEYNQKLMEYMMNPQALEEDMSKADEEAAQKFVERQTEQVRKNIVDNVKTVPQMREALQGLGENHDAVVQQLTKDEDENVANLAKMYQQITSLQRIGEKKLSSTPVNNVDNVGTTAALETFNRILSAANSVEEALDGIKKEIDNALQNVENKVEGSEYEAVVASRLQEVVDGYEEAKKAKNTEGDDSRKSKKTPKGKTKREKRPSLLDDEEEPAEKQKEPETKKKRKKPSLLDDEDESGDVSIDPDGVEEQVKHDVTLQDVFDSYEKKLGGEIDENTKQAIRDRIENDGMPIREALGDPELQDIYDELETGTFEKNLPKDKDSNDETIFDSLGQMNLDEAIEYLESLNPKNLSKADRKKAKELLKKLYERSAAPSAHEDSDEINSNANDNAGGLSNDPKLRSWIYAKYDFKELKDRVTRGAVYNSDPKAQDQLEALEELGAFEFVERGELGKLFKAEPDINIKYIKASDKRLNDAILLAVEMTGDRQKKAKAVRLIEGQDKKKYQVVGVLGFSSKDVISKDNCYDINREILKERGKNRPDFFVSDKFYNKIKHIYSGRMVKSGEVVSRDGNISGDVEDRTLKQMLHGVRPIIGVYYNAADFRVPALPVGADIVPLNTNNSNPREGSVWLMVQEADGRYYAKSIQVRRFTADEYDLEEHKDSPILQQIKEDLLTICDPDANAIDRYTAKYDLQEHLLYFPDGVDILYSGDTVSISGVDWGNNIGKGKSVEDKAQELLKKLQSDDLNLRFQISTSELSDSDYVQDLLDSDIMTSDLLQARNINASFDLYLNDPETGEPLEEIKKEDDSAVGHTGNRELNTALSGKTVNIGKTSYTLMSDGRVTRRNKEVTDQNIISQVKLIDLIEAGTIKPIEGTNVYIGVYDDGTEFGIKKTRTSYSVVDDKRIEDAREKADKLAKKKSKREALNKLSKAAEEATEEAIEGEGSDEALLRNVKRGLILQDEEQPTESEEKNEDLEEEQVEEKAPRRKKKGPPITGLQLTPNKPKEQPIAQGNLERFSRKRANREKILGMRDKSTGKARFKSLNEFYEYVRDPNNGLSKFTINSEKDVDTLIDTVDDCRA